MQAFTYRYPVGVYFGEGAAKSALGHELASFGKTIMVAFGGGSVKRNGIYDELVSVLEAHGKRVVPFGGIMSNPTYQKVLEGARLANAEGVDAILAVGGGSVIDCSKIIAVQARTGKDVWTMQYVDHQMPAKALKLGAVVTAFGTGAEMNNGAVITNVEKRMKAPLQGAFASFAVLDPSYTMTMPMGQVVSGSFDILSHCMETYLGSPREENLSDALNEAVMRSVIRNIRQTLRQPGDKQVRSELVWAAAMGENGILKLGKTTDFQCHMLEHQVGAYTNCNHGQGLAVIHPVLYRHLYKENPRQFARLARTVWGVEPEGRSDEEVAMQVIKLLASFIKEIGLPSTFDSMGIDVTKDAPAIAHSTIRTPGCAKRFSDEELETILRECQG